MSKRRAIILAVVKQGRSQRETAHEYGVSQGWVSKLVNQYRTHGEEAFEPASRRPLTVANKTRTETIQLIVSLRDQLTSQGLDAGADTIKWHLETHHQIRVSRSTIRRHLIKAGRITPNPKKRPKASYIRFEASLPNETWQSDVTHYHVGTPQPRKQTNRAEILTWLDDHSRYALSVTAHLPVTGRTVVETLRNSGQDYGLPASVLTDNGFIYTTRFAAGGQNALEIFCIENSIDQKHSRPHRPTTCGKVERFQQTMKNWLQAQPNQPTSITSLQTLLNEFVNVYNNQRPHRSIGRRTPTTAYNALPKAGPTTATKTSTNQRIRYDIIDQAGKVTLRRGGKLHHIGIGRQHKATAIVMIINNLDIRVINTQTGELLRHLTLDPNRDYQPQNQKRTP